MGKDQLDVLDFTNYRDHPTQKDYQVFFFADDGRPEYFEELLNENNITFERFVEEDRDNRTLFGIHRRDMTTVLKINDMVSYRFRQNFIPQKKIRYGILLFTILVVLLALIGFMLTD